MKKIFRAYMSLILIFISAGPGVEANSFMPEHSPYTFIPEGRPLDVQEYRKPEAMADILPNRPVLAHDKNGNRLYYSTSGKLTLKVMTDGTQIFSLKNGTVERDARGNIISTTELINNTGKSVKKNAKGEVLGYSQTGFGGKTIADYDAEGNLTKTYHYNSYGKSLEYVMDEMSQTKTVFNDKGQMRADVDFEGNEIAWYHYDAQSRLTEKIDGNGNVTFFNKEGNTNYTTDYTGRITARYVYKQDEVGRKLMDFVEDTVSGNRTYYIEGKQVTKNVNGEVIKDYSYDGSKLVYTFDRQKNETTWYDIGGKPLYTTYNDVVVSQYLYYKGKQVGLWDQQNNTVTIFQNQREALTIRNQGTEPPTAKQIDKWVKDGIIQTAQDVYQEYMNSEPWSKRTDLSKTLPALDTKKE